MRSIPTKQREAMGKFCICCGGIGQEGHHPLRYKNKQIDEITVLLCTGCHRGYNGDIWPTARLISEMRAIKDNLEYLNKNYPRNPWELRLNYLTKVWKSPLSQCQ